MKLRSISRILAILLVAGLCVGLTWGQSRAEYPEKPVNFLIPFGVGGSADLMGRALASAAKPHLGQPVVPINRPGAGGGIMYTALKESKSDGYTVGWNSTSLLTSTNIGNVPFKYNAFENVCRIGFTAMPIAVLAKSPWKTFGDLVAYAKANPGKIKIGNAGTGSATHLTAVLAQVETGIKVVHVPLGAKRRVPSLLGGEVEAICVPLPEAAPQVKAGQLRLLVMSSSKRDPKYPDVPTFTELGYPVVMELFRGISVPKNTPASAVNTLSDSFAKAARGAEFTKIANAKGFNIDFMGPKAFAAYLKEQDAIVARGMKLGGLVK